MPRSTLKIRFFYVTATFYTTNLRFPDVFVTFPSCYPRLPPVVVKNNKNIKNIELGVVWEVVELNWEIVTDLYSTISLQKCINKGREVHESGLEPLRCYVGGIGTLIPPTFDLDFISLCCRAWRVSSLEKRSKRTRSRFCEVPSLRTR